MVVVVVVAVFITAATLQGLLLLAAAVAVLLCDDCELMQANEGTNSAALTFRVENLLSIDLSCDVGGPTISPLLSACCSHESGAMLFAMLNSCFDTRSRSTQLNELCY